MVTFLLAMALSGTPCAPKTPSVAEVEKAALDARLAVRTMYIRMKINHLCPSRPDRDMIGVRTIWLDGKRIRGEIIREKGPNVGSRFVDCLNCEKEGYGIHWVDLPQMAASLHAIGAKGTPQFDDAIDPRLLGYYPNITDIFRPAQTRLNGYIGSTNRDEPSLSSEKLNNADCWVLNWTTKPGGTKVMVWIAPSRGNSVVRLKTVSPRNTVRVVDSDVALVGKSGLWFPRLTVLEEHEGDKLTLRETVEVEEVRLNEPINPSVFTIAGLNISEGTYVEMPDPKQSGYIRNGKIDSSRPTTRFQDTTPAEAPTPVNPPARGVNYWLVAACAVCVLAAIAVLLFRRRSGTPAM